MAYYLINCLEINPQKNNKVTSFLDFYIKLLL